MKKNDRPAALRLWQVRAVLAVGEICASVDTRKGSNSHNQAFADTKAEATAMAIERSIDGRICLEERRGDAG